MNILILGSGGREHALATKLSQSPFATQLFVAPGNGGTAVQFCNINLNLSDFEDVATAIAANKIGLVVIGPEQPLVDGLVDFLENYPDSVVSEVPVVGPNQACARLEGSKEFSKRVMESAGIPTAKSTYFVRSEWEKCQQYIENHRLPVVIKADGLAAGKGVAVCNTVGEAIHFARQILVESAFGEGNSGLLVEDFLSGTEVSMFVLTDGTHHQLLPEAKDYKRVFDGDLGPNTGGMGSVSPVPFVDRAFTEKVKTKIIDPLFKTLNTNGLKYKGFLFIGLMNDGGEPFVVEFNARLGDPETETILQRIDSDLVPALLSLKTETLHLHPIQISNRAAATVVVCAENYPDRPTKGDEIQQVSPLRNGFLFHAGTRIANKKLETNGGRVMACTASAPTLSEAISNAYDCVKLFSFRAMQYRKDIGQDILALMRTNS